MGEALDRVVSLAGTPTLRAALETRDSTTIRRNLDLLLESSMMEWLAVATPDGTVVENVDDGGKSVDEDIKSRKARHYIFGTAFAVVVVVLLVLVTFVRLGAFRHA